MSFTGPAEDRLALRELLETYADAVTRCDAQAWGATWAQDAEWSLPDYPEIGTTTGRPAIVAMWVEAMKHYPGIMFEAWPGSIAVDGARAVMRSSASGAVRRRRLASSRAGIAPGQSSWATSSTAFATPSGGTAPSGQNKIGRAHV